MRYFVFLLCFVTSAASAQSLRFAGTDKPIEVTADQGIELQQDAKRVIARGNAKAVQGDVTVTSDELIADYRTTADGETEVYRVFATGNVVMKSSTETATGEIAIYDFDKAVLVLEGATVALTNPDGSVTAHKTLQYWGNDGVAVAEGNAVAVDKEKRRLYGDKLIAFFKSAPAAAGAKPGANVLPSSKGDIQLLQGFGNVRMETAKETVRGERGTYNIETGIATLDGGVKITQDNNQLGGGFAVVNVKGGTSRLFPNAKAAGMSGVTENRRVAALLAPSPRQEIVAKPRPDIAAPPASAPAAKGTK